MRIFLLSSVFLGLFFLAGCNSHATLTPAVPATHPPVQAQATTPNPTSAQTATLEPSLTPTGTASPTVSSTAAPTTQLQVLDYPSLGLRLALPPGYQWSKTSLHGDLLLSVAIKQKSDVISGYDLAPISLRVFQKPAETSLADWFNSKQGDCYERGGHPPAGEYFIAPGIENRADFQGNPALRYESGCWPVPYEIVIDRGSLVIALSYLRDYPIDLETGFNQILASMAFFEPSADMAAIRSPATPTPVVCFDEQAAPLAVPTRQTPLEVRFLSDGNVWVWEEGGTAQQISKTGDALHFTFSPDGEVIVFERSTGDYPWGDYKIELWAINRDGQGLRQLVSAEQFDAFLPERHPAWVANVPIDYRWFPDSHKLSFGVYAVVHALGGGSAPEGYWIVDADSLALEKWDNPQSIELYAPHKYASPDGKVVARVDQGYISLLNADGSVIRNDILTYPAEYLCSEGPCPGGVAIFWTFDSRFLDVLIAEEDPVDESFSTWQITADGSSAQKLHTFDGMFYDTYIAPNQETIAYLRRVQPMSNTYELHLAKFDGSQDVTYATGYDLRFQNWSPDSYHFVFGQTTVNQPNLGSLCGGSVPLVDPGDTPASEVTWVDANRFIFVSGGEGQPRQLRLGQVGGSSILIGPFIGDPTYDTAYYEIKPEK